MRRSLPILALVLVLWGALPGCVTPLVEDHCVAPAWEWANRDKLVVAFHAPATGEVVRWDAGMDLSGKLPELEGDDRRAALEDARAAGVLAPGERVLGCFDADLDRALGPGPLHKLIVARERREPVVLVRGERGWARCDVTQLDYRRTSPWKVALVVAGAVPLFLVAIPVDAAIFIARGIQFSF